MVREKDKTAQFTMRLPQAMKDEVQSHAKAADIDAVTWIRHAIREKLDRENGKETIPEIISKLDALEKRLNGIVVNQTLTDSTIKNQRISSRR